MEGNKNTYKWWETLLGIKRELKETPKPEIIKETPKPTGLGVKPAVHRSTQRPITTSSSMLMDLDKDNILVEPGYQYEVIPLIRKLALSNQSVSQALLDIVSLANTGHKVEFDNSVSIEQATEMRKHLESVIPTWLYGLSGGYALAGKLLEQLMIAGAICVEIVPNKDLKSVSRFFIPLPESIRFKYNLQNEIYEPYQLIKPEFHNERDFTKLPFDSLKKLNPNTFKYFPINGNTEIPYGNPPYLPALPPLHDQREMLDNIKWIIQQMGAWGFLEMIVDLPDQEDGESMEQYESRCVKHMADSRERILAGVKDGIVVGGKHRDEVQHEFEFHSPSKNTNGLRDVFDLNESLVQSGLKQDPSLSGKASAGAQTFVTVIFTKLLSGLKNYQTPVKTALEYAYNMELRLRGFKYKSLTVKFNPSTLSDDLKVQQALEIKIRNSRQLRMDGIINQDQYADALGYDKPYKQEPIVPFEKKDTTGDPNLDAEKKRVREKSKDVSDKRVRDKNK